MCGLVAVHSPRVPLDERRLRAALATLRHRGPDGSGTWVAGDGRVGLGHTRLAVIDPLHGDQPLPGGDGRSWIVVTGEFYGYERIREELRAHGRRLRSASDSEVAVHLHELYGEGALQRLRGEFALVLWDAAGERLVAARDRFGIKPLYYAVRDGALCLASEVKALLAWGLPARLDRDALADHLQLALPVDRTLFDGVRQVPPGAYLVADATGVGVRPWWDLDFPAAAELAGAPEPAPEALAVALREAVEVRLRADVPVACHLSGGLDSAAVSALAADGGGPLTAFTVRFDDDAFDEGEPAAQSARWLGLGQREIPLRRADLAAALEEAVRAGEMVQENAHGVARLLQSAAIRAHGYKVVLAGEGGDELFGAYPQFRRDLALASSPAARARAEAGYAKLDALGFPAHLRTLREAVGFVPSWVLERYMTVTRPVAGLLAEEFAARLAARDSAAGALAAAGTQLHGRSPFHQSLYLFYRTWLCNYILAAERLDMAHAVEVRLPLLDHRLFETVRGAPLRWYGPDGPPKRPLLEALAGRLPPHLASAPKQPFFAPPVAVADGVLDTVRRLAGGDALRSLGVFDPARVDDLLDRLARRPPHERAGSERALQLVASTAVLAETFDLGVAA